MSAFSFSDCERLSRGNSFSLPPLTHEKHKLDIFLCPSYPSAVHLFPKLNGGPNSLNSEISSQYSAKYRSSSDLSQTKVASSPFLPKSESEECLKCLLKVPHKRCESHKYIRVGGGYRHGYWYVKTLLEELELQRQRELIRQQRLQAITEKEVKAIKTYIRTKSGRLIEKIIFLSEEDYAAFKAGKNVADILSKYLSKDEAAGLESWDKDEVKAIKTYVRTKSGRLIEKVVYVSKSDYDAITSGAADAKDLLKKYAGEGEVIEGWDEAKMKTIKTYVRTKSGRLIEKTIMISQEDYDAMIRDGKNPNDILKKYLSLDDGEQFESWTSAEPMKAIKTMVRTKSGRLIEKTVYVSAEDYDKLIAGGGDMNEILGKYMNDDDGKIEGWEKAPSNPMKVVKTFIRTKSGRLIEKQILLTEEEYRRFQESGGDPDFLKQFIKLEAGEVIDSWEKASTVYSAGSDVRNAKEGQRIVGKDGQIYEVVVDPITGKKYKKRVGGKESDIDSGFASMQKGKKGKDETAEERKKRKQGGRDAGSDSDYSYRSVVSAGGTRHVRRRRKHADGTYSDSESYHSDKDPEGAARRRRRRREREHQNSAHSYYSVTSEGGTRTVRRKKKNADGTYGDSESYHSEDSHKEGGGLAERKKKQKEKTEREEAEKRRKARKERHGSGSDHSYFSETSQGGTRTVKRKKKIKDEHGNVIGYGDAESYHSDNESVYTEVSDGKGGKIKVKKENPKKAGAKGRQRYPGLKKKKQKDPNAVFSDSDCTTDSDDVDLENMTEEEKKPILKGKAERAAAREARRREKYGDKYDEMMSKHAEFKEQKAEEKKKEQIKKEKEAKKKAKEEFKKNKLQELRDRGLISPSSDWTIDSDTGEPLRKAQKAEVKEKKKQKKLQELRDQGLISPSSDWTLDSDGEPARRSELVKQGKRPPGEDGKGGKGGKGKKNKDGNEADDESDEEYIDPVTGEVKRRPKQKDGKEEPKYKYEYDDQGRVIRKTRINAKPGDEGSEYEYDYDEDGNVKVKKTKGKKGGAGDDSDDEQFEVGADGKIRLKPGKKKIDLDKLTDDDLRRLGIDPTLSKAEIARRLKEKFGDDIDITEGKKKIGTKNMDDYGSDANTDDMANDSDLDVSTLIGNKRVNVKLKRGGQAIIDHMKKIITQSSLREEIAKNLDERGDIDFVTHYRLVDPNKVESYAKAFVVEDDDMDTVLSFKETNVALDGVPSVQQMTNKQLDYVLSVLNLNDASRVTFRMFAVISALCDRVTMMDPLSKHLLEICNLLDIERKMDLYKAMFYCNVESERDNNFIKAESLRIELIAGGLNWKQQEFIMERLQPNSFFEVSFLDYLVYVPLFLSMHDNICDNPLDMSDNKYDSSLRKPSGALRQRDINPLGQPLKKTSTYMLKQRAKDLAEGRISKDDLRKEQIELLNKYNKLPDLLADTPLPRTGSPPGLK
ncbi:unnamed protein product [Mytilus edulis]|uniref:Uncharacterized protein n=1 Tax=Mytilus edulis TaxID=6550 RepID=A0A8S3VB53_MYTED|nr:unnamed protein product [Mytilus edulis]